MVMVSLLGPWISLPLCVPPHPVYCGFAGPGTGPGQEQGLLDDMAWSTLDPGPPAAELGLAVLGAQETGLSHPLCGRGLCSWTSTSLAAVSRSGAMHEGRWPTSQSGYGAVLGQWGCLRLPWHFYFVTSWHTAEEKVFL
jgi:hypothetical protein